MLPTLLPIYKGFSSIVSVLQPSVEILLGERSWCRGAHATSDSPSYAAISCLIWIPFPEHTSEFSSVFCVHSSFLSPILCFSILFQHIIYASIAAPLLTWYQILGCTLFLLCFLADFRILIPIADQAAVGDCCPSAGDSFSVCALGADLRFRGQICVYCYSPLSCHRFYHQIAGDSFPNLFMQCATCVLLFTSLFWTFF